MSNNIHRQYHRKNVTTNKNMHDAFHKISAGAVSFAAVAGMMMQVNVAQASDVYQPHHLDLSRAAKEDKSLAPWQEYENIYTKQRYRGVEADGTLLSLDSAKIGDFDKVVKKSVVRGYLTKQTNPVTGVEDYFLMTDVFFNNDGISMLQGRASKGNLFEFRIPYSIVDLQANGLYKQDSIVNMYVEAYQRTAPIDQLGIRLSDHPYNFKAIDEHSYYLKGAAGNNGYQEYRGKGDDALLFDHDIREGSMYKKDLWSYFKDSRDDDLLRGVSVHYGQQYKGKSYTVGLRTRNADYAYHMHLELKVKPMTLTHEERQQGMSIETKMIDEIKKADCFVTTSTRRMVTKSSYTFVSGLLPDEKDTPDIVPDRFDPHQEQPGEHQQTQAEQFPLKGKDARVKVGDHLYSYAGKVVDSNLYTELKDSSNGRIKPQGMQWSWKGKAPEVIQKKVSITTYRVDAKFADGSHDYPLVTITVVPKAPTILTDTHGLAGKSNVTINVNTEGGVPDGATVVLYDKKNGNKILGEGKVIDNKAQILVTQVMPETKIYAKTKVSVVPQGERSNVDLESDYSNEKDTTKNIIPVNDPSASVPEGYARISFTKDDASIEKLTGITAYDVKTGLVKLNELAKPGVVAKSGYRSDAITWVSDPHLTDDAIIMQALTIKASAQKIATTEWLIPEYSAKQGKPGASVEVGTPDFTDKNHNKKTLPPDGTKYAKQDGDIIVDGDTGKVTVKIPDNAHEGEVISAHVTVTYPDGSSVIVPVNVTVAKAEPSAPADNQSYEPKYADKQGKPGEKVQVGTPTFTENNGNTIIPPAGITYEKSDGDLSVDHNTGSVIVNVPNNATVGQKVSGKVKVRYPDGTTDEVPVTVSVANPAPTGKGKPSGHDNFEPKYDQKQGKPGETVSVGTPTFTDKNKKEVLPPKGTTYEKIGSNNPLQVDEHTGDVNVAIPANKQPGDSVTGKVTVKYPDGTTDEVTITVTVAQPAPSNPTDKHHYEPKYASKQGKPGSTVDVGTPNFTDSHGKPVLPPEGTHYEKVDKNPDVTVDPKTGRVTVIIGKDKEDRDVISTKVKVIYPDGTSEETPVNVTVTLPAPSNRDKDRFQPNYQDKFGEAGKDVNFGTPNFTNNDYDTVLPPEGTTYEKGSETDSSKNITYTLDKKTGNLTVSVPADKKSGDEITVMIKVTYPDHSSEEVPASLIVNTPKVIDPSTKYANELTPQYEIKHGKAGESVNVGTPTLTDKTGNIAVIPTGTTFAPESQSNELKVDANTGNVTMNIPNDKKPGENVTAQVKVTYPDKTTDIATVRVIVDQPSVSAHIDEDKNNFEPKYDEKQGKPGATVNVGTPTFNDKHGKPTIPPDNTTFENIGNTPGIKVNEHTGKVTVVIPQDKPAGTKVVSKVKVKYPDGTTDEVPVTVSVVDSTKPDTGGDKKHADLFDPMYQQKRGKAGQTVSVGTPDFKNDKQELVLPPEGTKYEKQNGDLLTVDPSTGEVNVSIPKDKKAGDEITGEMKVTYPDKTTDIAMVKVIVDNASISRPIMKNDFDPKYTQKHGQPGTTVDFGTPTFTDSTGNIILPPDNTKYEFKDHVPAGTSIDSQTGAVSISIPNDKKPGDTISLKVKVTYPDGSIDETSVTVAVDLPAPSRNKDCDSFDPKYAQKHGKPGSTVDVGTPDFTDNQGKKVVPPNGTHYEKKTGDNLTIDSQTGKVTVTIPQDAKPNSEITGVVKVIYPDGSSEDTQVTVTVGKPSTTSGDKKEDNSKFIPEYPSNKKGKPGMKVDLGMPDFTDKTGKKVLPPEGTRFESGDPNITVDKTTGSVAISIPKDKKPGETVSGKVTITYPDGTKKDIPVSVTVDTPAASIRPSNESYEPEYDLKYGMPGSVVNVGTPTFKDENGKGKIVLPPNDTQFEKEEGDINLYPQAGGKVLVKIPKNKKPGDRITGKVKVTYPDGSVDHAAVTVIVDLPSVSNPGADNKNYQPEYPTKKGKPGSKVEVGMPDFTDKTGKKVLPPEGTRFESGDPNITVDKTTGSVAISIPKDKKPGETVSGKVTITYPDGSSDEVNVTVIVDNPAISKPSDSSRLQPKYPKKSGKPCSKVEVGTPDFTDKTGKKVLPPEGTRFESGDPNITVDNVTGKVTISVPDGVKPGDRITGKVKVTYPDGSVDEVPVVAVVGKPGINESSNDHMVIIDDDDTADGDDTINSRDGISTKNNDKRTHRRARHSAGLSQTGTTTSIIGLTAAVFAFVGAVLALRKRRNK